MIEDDLLDEIALKFSIEQILDLLDFEMSDLVFALKDQIDEQQEKFILAIRNEQGESNYFPYGEEEIY